MAATNGIQVTRELQRLSPTGTQTLWDGEELRVGDIIAVSYTHLRAHETVLDLVCRLLLENKKYMVITCTFVLNAL